MQAALPAPPVRPSQLSDEVEVSVVMPCLNEARNERLGLTTPGMEFASEMVVKACLHKQRISEVPTVLRPDGRDRPPHLRSFRDGWRHLRFLLLMCPAWLFRVPSVCLVGVGLAGEGKEGQA